MFAQDREFREFLEKGESPCDYEKTLLQEHFDRVTYILTGGNPPPYELEIQPSSDCNLTCKHCFGRAYRKLPNKMTPEALEEIAKKVADFKQGGFEIDTVKFCGVTGEPLLNSAVLQAIRTFKDLGKKVIVFSNGVLLDHPVGSNGEQYLDHIVEADQLNLSLDAGSEKTFAKLKGKKEVFGNIIRSLESLVKKRESKGSNLQIDVSYVIGRQNYHEIAQAATLVKYVGVDNIKFRIDFTNTGQIRDLSEPIIKDLKRAKEFEGDGFKVIPVYSEGTITGNTTELNSYARQCFNSYFWASIGPDCELYACGHRTYCGVISFGSLLEKSFRDLWESPERLSTLKTLPDGHHCKICSPSSARRNDFMTYLSGLSLEEVKLLHDRHIKE